MNRILIVDGGPRRNMNTSALCDSLAEGARTASSEIEMERIRLYDLHNVISLRMEETLGLIRARLDRQKLLTQLKGGVVLTGGGAHMENILQLAENVFGLPCAIGEPRGIDGLSKQLARPEYATGLGALLYAEKTEREQAARAGGFWRKIVRLIGW